MSDDKKDNVKGGGRGTIKGRSSGGVRSSGPRFGKRAGTNIHGVDGVRPPKRRTSSRNQPSEKKS